RPHGCRFSPPADRRRVAVNWIALRMLIGDRAKYLGIHFGIAFATRTSGSWTASSSRWTTSGRCRAAPWTGSAGSPAAPGRSLLQGSRPGPPGRWRFRLALLLGVDDATLVGAPREMVQGTLADLRRPDAVLVEEAGFALLWPGEPRRTGKV